MKDTYDFGDALYFLRQGRTVARKSWDNEELELDGLGKIISHVEHADDALWQPKQDDILAEDWYDL